LTAALIKDEKVKDEKVKGEKVSAVLYHRKYKQQRYRKFPVA